MGFKTRYLFTKRTFPKTIVIFAKDNRYLSYQKDQDFLKYLKFKRLKDLDKLRINYIVLHNMEIINHKVNKVNMYDIYYARFFLTEMIETIKSSLH